MNNCGFENPGLYIRDFLGVKKNSLEEKKHKQKKTIILSMTCR
jgi:hypothetical protein